MCSDYIVSSVYISIYTGGHSILPPNNLILAQCPSRAGVGAVLLHVTLHRLGFALWAPPVCTRASTEDAPMHQCGPTHHCVYKAASSCPFLSALKATQSSLAMSSSSCLADLKQRPFSGVVVLLMLTEHELLLPGGEVFWPQTNLVFPLLGGNSHPP